MLSSPEPENPRLFTKANWERAKQLLEEIFGLYAFMFWPTDDQAPTNEWRDVREVAMPAFLHYFNNALLAAEPVLFGVRQARGDWFIAPWPLPANERLAAFP